MRKLNLPETWLFPLAGSVAAGVVMLHAVGRVLLPPEGQLLFSELYAPAANGLATLALAYAAWRSQRRGNRHWSAWGWLALAQATYTIADSVWAVLELGTAEPPALSLADLFYLLFYPLFAVGLWRLPIAPRPALERLKLGLDIGMVLVAAALFQWVFLLAPLTTGSPLSPVELAVVVAYPVLDWVVLFTLLRLLLGAVPGPDRRPLALLMVGTIVMLLCDTVYVGASAQGTYETGSWLDTAFILSYVLVGLAGLAQGWQGAEVEPKPQPAALRTGWGLVLPYGWALAAYLLLIWNFWQPLPISREILAGGVGLIFGLTFWRQLVVARENAQLYRQEVERRRLAEALAQAGRELTSSLELAEIPGRILEQLARVVPYERGAVLLARDQCLQIVAQRGFPDDERAKALRIQIRPDDPFLLMSHTHRPLIIDDVTQEPGWQIVPWLPLNRSWLGVPLVWQERTIGMISLTRRPAAAFTADEVVPALAFASQAAIALENARLYDELARAYHSLALLDKTKADFIDVMAHELRTPLTVIKGYAQMLRALPPVQAQPEAQPLLEGMLNGMQRMQELVNSVLDVTRIDTQSLRLSKKRVMLAQIVQQVLEQLSADLAQRRLLILVESLETLPPVLADPDLLYKVFYHLVVNAIKFTPDGGRITISGAVVATGPLVEVVVSDTGIGIAPEQQPLIFEKFYQTGQLSLHSSGRTKFKGGGPGLGLSIARGIVLAHGGQLWVESPGYDEQTCPGSRFYVRLPVGTDEEQPTPRLDLDNLDHQERVIPW